MISPNSLRLLAAIGRVFFATAILFFGVQHFVHGEFVTRLLPAWPAWFPGRGAWPYVVGFALIAAGAALLLEDAAHRVALGLGTVVMISALLLAIPPAVRDPSIGLAWTSAGKALMLGGGAFIVAATSSPRRGRPDPVVLLGIGRATLACLFVLCGIQHFLWAQFVAHLVPGWIPGAMFWTYFAGVALIAGGCGLLLRPTARLAAFLSAAMVFLWVILLHIPRALTDLGNANESTAVFEALAASGIALMLATLPLRARGNLSAAPAATLAPLP